MLRGCVIAPRLFIRFSSSTNVRSFGTDEKKNSFSYDPRKKTTTTSSEAKKSENISDSTKKDTSSTDELFAALFSNAKEGAQTKPKSETKKFTFDYKSLGTERASNRAPIENASNQQNRQQPSRFTRSATPANSSNTNYKSPTASSTPKASDLGDIKKGPNIFHQTKPQQKNTPPPPVKKPLREQIVKERKPASRMEQVDLRSQFLSKWEEETQKEEEETEENKPDGIQELIETEETEKLPTEALPEYTPIEAIEDLEEDQEVLQDIPYLEKQERDLQEYRRRNMPTCLINNEISANEVTLIDINGSNLGVVRTMAAIAQAKGYKGVLVQVKVGPTPTCKIFNAKEFKQMIIAKMEEHKNQRKTMKLKEMRFKQNIAEHDVQVKVNKMEAMLLKGYNVKIVIEFTSFKTFDRELGDIIMDNILARIEEIAKPAGNRNEEGLFLSQIVATRKKQEKPKNEKSQKSSAQPNPEDNEDATEEEIKRK